MIEQYSTETIYDGSVECPKCGIFMTPVEAMYTDGKMCPTCRNALYGKHMKGAMSGR
jgi:ribosomal protein S27AE